MNYAIIGCGLIGRKRLAALAPSQLAVACDTELRRAEALVQAAGQGRAVAKYQEAVSDPAVEAVIVCTINAALAEVAAAAIRAGKPVLVEKPAGINSRQIQNLLDLANQNRVPVRVGFNHRYHPAFRQARTIFESGALGEMMFVRGRYGHGGRVGYDREWRANPQLSGGGELLDQGMHLIDLARWFLGDFARVSGHADRYYWDMPVEDNGFMDLVTAGGQTAWLHVSCSEWKNLFSFEIYGKKSKLHIEGLGGSYGLERLAFYQMRPELGPPDTLVWEYPRGDDSWNFEMRLFEEDARQRRRPDPGLADALAAMRVVERIYAASGIKTVDTL
jgi:predicted dehydrogenase